MCSKTQYHSYTLYNFLCTMYEQCIGVGACVFLFY